MKLVRVENLQVGMKLGENIYRDQEQLIIAEGAVLNIRYIEIIKELEYINVEIHAEPEFRKTTESNKPDLNERFNSSVQKYHAICVNLVVGQMPLYEEIQECIDPLIENIKDNSDVAMRLWQIESTDFYTYEHSIKVSMIAALIGKWLGAGDEKIRNLALTGVLHDIGKCNIPNEILNKPDMLTDEEFRVMKTHSTLGYVLAKRIKGIGNDINQGVLQHHERYDGTGYPSGSKGSEIHEFARIVAVADIFDAMTSDRIYRSKKNPLYVLKSIRDSGYAALDPKIATVFVDRITQCFVGCKVRLNEGLSGRIVKIDKWSPMRPLVETATGFINLKIEKSYEILEVLLNEEDEVIVAEEAT